MAPAYCCCSSHHQCNQYINAITTIANNNTRSLQTPVSTTCLVLLLLMLLNFISFTLLPKKIQRAVSKGNEEQTGHILVNPRLWVSINIDSSKKIRLSERAIPFPHLTFVLILRVLIVVLPVQHFPLPRTPALAAIGLGHRCRRSPRVLRPPRNCSRSSLCRERKPKPTHTKRRAKALATVWCDSGDV